MNIFQFLMHEQFRASLELINGWLFSHLAISEGVGLKNPVFRLNKSLGSAFKKEQNTYAHPPTHTQREKTKLRDLAQTDISD